MGHMGVGPLEIGLLLALAMGWSFTTQTRRWMPAVLACLALGIVATPPDPVSMLLVAVPLIVVFAAGVSMAGFLRTPKNA